MLLLRMCCGRRADATTSVTNLPSGILNAPLHCYIHRSFTAILHGTHLMKKVDVSGTALQASLL